MDELLRLRRAGEQADILREELVVRPEQHRRGHDHRLVVQIIALAGIQHGEAVQRVGDEALVPRALTGKPAGEKFVGIVRALRRPAVRGAEGVQRGVDLHAALLV